MSPTCSSSSSASPTWTDRTTAAFAPSPPGTDITDTDEVFGVSPAVSVFGTK